MQSSVSDAALWITEIVTGPVATTLGILAVAMLGMAMLAGHLDKPRTLRILLGLAIVFAAPLIPELPIWSLYDWQSESGSIPLDEPHDVRTDTPNSVCWTC